MPLSWNEINSRAISFSKEAEAKESLEVFGISRKCVVTLEHKVEKLNEANRCNSQHISKMTATVLDASDLFPDDILTDLRYLNLKQTALVKAQPALDKAVDLCYRSQAFTSEAKRIEFLFELYDKYTAGLFVKEKKLKKDISVAFRL